MFVADIRFSSFNHVNVIKCLGWNKAEKHFSIVMEYASLGELHSYLAAKPISSDQAVAFALQIAQGMKYIHDKKIMHLDLKPENILVCYHYM